ncbi:glycosyltransferase family protein [Sulfobacillus thermosulfidooxidans]|uniref:glycosyltransferase family protein n=1 Tax=Sulfobacillus thermosulfidooxidans TaxID=28034 RepID=UPI0002D92FE2|nr:glycosyltransferase family protein [Sulfobacillus thermosulfidooxidans]
MNNETVSFISCINDENLYRMCVSHIQNLIIPPGLNVELIAVRGATSMASGYNLGMSRARGKYKIYLHQDVFILNTNLINDILYLFWSFPKAGLIGLCGTETVPESGIWWEGNNRFGQVLEFRDKYQLLRFNPFSELVREVGAIDGFFMATQIDLEWNEAIPGFHLYDTSHSFDYRTAGWKVIVPNQKFPWTLHYCGTDWDIEAYRRSLDSFRKIYSSYLSSPSKIPTSLER